MGNITASILFRSVFGNKKITAGVFSPSRSYDTDGESYSLGLFGLLHLEFLMIQPAGGYEAEWDKANSKIILRAQEPTSLSSGTIEFTECDPTDDLSAKEFYFMALGY